MDALEREHTILIIDDQPLNLKVLADYLSARGLQVLIAADGESGLERARYAQPDLIILDVLLPGMDGIETCRRLKADARTRAIPVLFMTVAISPADKLRGFEAGGVDYLSKPIQEAELLARVTVHLRVQEQQQRLQKQTEALAQEIVERQQVEAELAQQRALLEQRVAERTAALTQANRQLMTEIAERQQVEAALRKSEERFAKVFNYSAAIMILVDLATMTLVDVNQAYCQMLGYTKEEVINHPGQLGFATKPAYLASALQLVQETDHLSNFELTLITKNGKEINGLLFAEPVDIQGRRLYILTFVDITERQQAERELAQSREQLRNLAEYLQSAREQERATIAREIHDEFGQALTALKIDLAWLARRLPAPSDLAGKIDIMLNLVDDAINTVRHIATELRPGLLDDLGLVAAIEWQTQDFARRTGLTYTLSLGDHDLDLEPDLATALFRILQESLTNVARHAEATHIEVALDDQPALLTLRVRDNGHGIAPTQLASNHSLGLMGMRERARVWGGDVVVEGRAGQGTTVTVHIPQPAVRAHALGEWL